MEDLNAQWRKSSHSGGNGGECIEVANLTGTIGIRDSKNPDGPKLLVARAEFVALLATLKH
ncbi:DUF397 domain-containing protein [Actinomadura geliboluensis]|uniref:DUF397 domain-containing protein n=1 Tax=Actinomadura geliboluensis TaxID=882440 RepID=A0A5S4H6B0_9ACTN|nr:DUF397 domain-containing protein [Actinomadura geliboluensis]TMR40768.1 DUF397 domain-containing protein [Actinomadura geliboluensis]